MATTVKKTGIAAKCIKFIERAGNKLPHPFILFGIFILFTLLVSFVLSKLGFEATYLDEGKKVGDAAKMVTVKVVNLLTFDNMRKLIVNLYSDLITSAGFNREISQMRYATVINTIVVVKNIILSHRTGLFSHSAEITTFLLISIRRNK